MWKYYHYKKYRELLGNMMMNHYMGGTRVDIISPALNTMSLPEKKYWMTIIEGLWKSKGIGVLLVNSENLVVACNETCSAFLGKQVTLNTSVVDLFNDVLFDGTNQDVPSERKQEKGGVQGSKEPDIFSRLYNKKGKIIPNEPGNVSNGIVFRAKIAERYFLVREFNLKLARTSLSQKSLCCHKIYFITEETEKVCLKQELQKTRLLNHQLEEVFDSSFDELYVTDAEGKTIKASNLAFQRLYGYTSKSLVGKNVQDLVAAGTFWPSAFPKILKEKRPITFIQNTSKKRKMLVTSTPIFDENNDVVMVVSNSRDITELLNLRERLEQAEVKVQKYEEEINALCQDQVHAEGVIAESYQMKKVLYAASKAAGTDSTILILGQTGVGKDVLAKVVHKMSPRAKFPFMKLNCAAIPESLIEAELFGYEKGAFTGASNEGKYGLLELAEGGTIFLDEIAEIPLTLQAKFLDVFQDRSFMRIGGTKKIKVDARIVAATNRDLTQMVENGTFRRDLYYRLMVIPLEIPPLKDRPNDILPLATHFLKKYSEPLGVEKAFSPEAFDAFLAYEWPGNVRELQHVIERLVVMLEQSIIGLEMLPKPLQDAYFHWSQTMVRNGEEEEERLTHNWDLNNALEKVEERHLREAFHFYKSTRKVANALGISQSSVVRKFKKYDIN